MDHKDVAYVNLWKHPVDGELVIVLAQRSGDIVFVVARCVFFPHHSDMVVRSVHGRAHQIDGTGVHADILFVGMFFVNRFCHKTSVRSHHKSSKFRVDCHIPHFCRNEHFFVYFSYAFSDDADIIRLLVRTVWNSDSAGKIDKFDMNTGLFFQLDRCFEKHFGKHRVVLIRHRVACEKCVDSEFFCSF